MYNPDFLIKLGKYLLLMIFLYFFNLSSSAQKYVVSFPAGSTIYKGSEIPLTVIISGMSCTNIVIKCSNGSLSMIAPCEYIYRPKEIGETAIEVFVVKAKKLKHLGRQLFYVKERPMPEANIAGLKGGRIKKGNLKAQQGVGASWFVNGNHWEPCEIKSYNVIILRENKVLFEYFNEGNMFNKEEMEAFKTLAQNDRVLFVNITGCSERENGGLLRGMEFIVDE